MFVPAPMNATSKPSILTDRPVLIPEPYFHSNVSLPPASAELAAFRDTECYRVNRFLPSILEYRQTSLDLLFLLYPKLIARKSVSFK